MAITVVPEGQWVYYKIRKEITAVSTYRSYQSWESILQLLSPWQLDIVEYVGVIFKAVTLDDILNKGHISLNNPRGVWLCLGFFQNPCQKP